MEPKQIVHFDFEKEDRIYRFQMPAGAPLGEAYEASACFLAEMVRLINEHAEKMKPVEVKEVDESEES